MKSIKQMVFDVINNEDSYREYIDKRFPLLSEFSDLAAEDFFTVSSKEFRSSINSNSSGRDKFFSSFYKSEVLLEATKDKQPGIYLYNKNGYVYISRQGEGSYVYFNNRKRVFKNQRGNGHYSLNFNNTEITLEAFVLLGKCIYEDTYPLTFDQLVIDVIDGTGSKETCKKKGRKHNFTYSNVQLTVKDTNLTKGIKDKVLYEK